MKKIATIILGIAVLLCGCKTDKPTFGMSLMGQFIREVGDKYGPVEEVDVVGY